MPSQQYDAYVDTHEWPKEMEAVVVALRRRICTAPGCAKAYETLDHRIPWSKGGPTSVANLFPMCTQHNLEKGNTDYAKWVMIFLK